MDFFVSQLNQLIINIIVAITRAGEVLVRLKMT